MHEVRDSNGFGIETSQKKKLLEWMYPAGDSERKVAVFINPEVIPAASGQENAHFLWNRAGHIFRDLEEIKTYQDSAYQNPQIPETSENYPDVTFNLLRREHREAGVIEFLGGPTDWRDKWGIERSWLQPVEVDDLVGTETSSDFHLLYIDCYPWDLPDDVRVVFNIANETDLKLENPNDDVSSLRNLIREHDGKPTVVVRLSTVGSLYYPKMSTPVNLPSREGLRDKLNRLGRATGLNLDVADSQIDDLLTRAEFDVWGEVGPFVIGKAREITNAHGTFYAYGIYRPDDPWQFYEIYAAQRLETMDRHEPVQMRIDSGCDIGQLYSDRGCDCHAQLLTALGEIRKSGGIIVHAPTQDGRGYGMNTKMETEGGKRGMPAVYNQSAPGEFMEPMDTVAAAELVFQSGKFDLRTFDGMGVFLKMLGFTRVKVFTDNTRKIQALEDTGLSVERLKTNTAANADLSEETLGHIRAKHRTDLYLDDDSHR